MWRQICVVSLFIPATMHARSDGKLYLYRLY